MTCASARLSVTGANSIGMTSENYTGSFVDPELLYEEYPVSIWLVPMRSLPWLLSWIALVGLIVFTDIEKPFIGTDISFSRDLGMEGIICLLGIFAVLAIRMSYCTVWRERLRYFIRGHELILEQGVFIRERESYELAKLNGTHVGQSKRGFLFGLYYLEILIPGTKPGSGIRIDGFTRTVANDLQMLLHRRIESGI